MLAISVIEVEYAGFYLSVFKVFYVSMISVVVRDEKCLGYIFAMCKMVDFDVVYGFFVAKGCQLCVKR